METSKILVIIMAGMALVVLTGILLSMMRAEKKRER